MSGLPQSINLLGWNLVLDCCAKDLPPGGAALSPLSVTIALGMLAGGADMDHRRELCAKLRIADPSQLGSAFTGLLAALGADTSDNLSTANAIFTDQKYTVFHAYSTFLESFAVRSVQVPQLAAAADEINTWIAQQTRGLITRMLDASSLSRVQFVLVNALAFKGRWYDPFDQQDTIRVPFYGLHGTHNVEMMIRHRAQVLVCQQEHYTVVNLRYRGSQMSLLAYLPKENVPLVDCLQKIREDPPAQFSKSMLSRLGFPKFKIETGVDMTSILERLGYRVAGAYPGLGSGASERVGAAILHKAVVELDEEGTVAAAATGDDFIRASRHVPSPEIIFDRPFAFSIVEDTSGLVIFAGIFTAS